MTPSEFVTHGLGVCEGIEDGSSLLAHQWAPIWAMLGTSGMRNFPVLGGIECLTIFADRGDAGIDAAETCAERWENAGRETSIRLPKGIGDWNDDLHRGAV